MRPLLVLLAAAAVPVAPAAAQTADRYGYAPPEAQVPMRQAAAAPVLRQANPQVPALRTATPVAAAPPLRMLSWPGKAAAAPAFTPAATREIASAPTRPPVRTVAPTRWTAPRRDLPTALVAAAPPAPAATPSATAGVGPAPRLTFVAPPGLLAQAPVTPPPPVAAPASAQGVAVLGPPRNPWYQRWPEAAAAPDPAVAAGVGASLAPGTPAAPPPASGLSGYAAPEAGAAPTRTPAAAPAPRSTAKYYSVHTAYGHAADRPPIPPQFFSATADLSAPETPDPPRATLTANAAAAKAAVNAARLQQGAVD